MMRVLVLILFLHFCVGQPIYQERFIYYSEQDNVCYYGPQTDQLDVTIELDGVIAYRAMTLGSTNCREWVIRCEDKIVPRPDFYFYQKNTEIKFNEEHRYYRPFGLLVGILQNTTVQSPAKVNGQLRNCSILGNGQKNHYGGPNFTYQAPKLYVRCTSIPTEHLTQQ